MDKALEFTARTLAVVTYGTWWNANPTASLKCALLLEAMLPVPSQKTRIGFERPLPLLPAIASTENRRLALKAGRR